MQKIVSILYFLTLTGLGMSYSVTDPVYQSCMNNSYVKNGPYDRNLHKLLESLVRNVDSTHFNSTSYGQGDNAVYGLLQCRGGLSPSDCKRCASAIAQKIVGSCSTFSAFLQLNGCLLRYAYYDFVSVNPNLEFLNTTCDSRRQTRNPEQFEAAVTKILYEIDTKFMNGSNDFAVLSYQEDSTEIYVLGQCWGSVGETSCGSCFVFGFPSILTRNFLKLPVILGGVAAASVVVVLGIILWKHLQHRQVPESRGENYETGSPAVSLPTSQLNFNYEVLRNATRNFDIENKLGEGGFGSVYKGTLPDGREVAIKKLMMISRQGNDEFVNEVNLISSVQHRNLVKLLGFCVKGAERLLVYEYLCNKSLDQFLFDTKGSCLLDWQTRFNIILGTAHGLAYLHEESHIRIVHRDIKASNILLDEKLLPKIADFGLARLLSEDQSHVTTRIAGTLGYMAPEYAFHGQLTEKADIYSFGVLMLEIVSGRRNKDIKPEEDCQSLVEVIWKLHKSDKISEIIDHNLGTSFPMTEAIRAIHVALLCTQAVAKRRPSVSEVVHMLKTKNSSKLPIILGGLATASVVVILCIVLWKYLQQRQIPARRDESYGERGLPTISLPSLRLNFNYEVLRNATGDFDMENKLGEGGFGSVYKGTLPDGREVAVKRLAMISRQGNNEFVNEVNLISGVQHRNLVKLLGCCIKGPEKLLVYEYLPNKSLDKFLSDTKKSHLLDWQTRFNIILGTARGLAYLHEESHIRIVHRDIKASNILLDERFLPKIADFGLARLVSEDQSHVTTRVAGTLGYMAPEYAFHGQLTEKADIYSFGVLTLEIVSGRRNKDVKPEEDYQSLMEKTWKLHKTDKIFEIIDRDLGTSLPMDEVIKVIHVALLCTQAVAKRRPSMSDVVHMLKSKQMNLLECTDPAFVDLKGKGVAVRHTSQSSGLSTILSPSLAGSSSTFSSSVASSSYIATDTSVSVLEPR